MDPQIVMTGTRREVTRMALQVNMAAVARRFAAADVFIAGNKFETIQMEVFKDEKLGMCTGGNSRVGFMKLPLYLGN